MKTALRSLLFPLALAAALTGCAAGPSVVDPARIGPFFTPTNFIGDDQMPEEVRRVLVLPVYAGRLAPVESATTFDSIVVTALQRASRFEVVALSREDCRRYFGAPEFASTAALPHGFFEKLASTHAADAVLFIDLTTFNAYRPLSLGFRAKLATLPDIRLLWAFDEVFSAQQPAVVNSVRRHALRGTPGNTVPADLSPAALQSPARFGAYAAETMFSTLPPR